MWLLWLRFMNRIQVILEILDCTRNITSRNMSAVVMVVNFNVIRVTDAYVIGSATIFGSFSYSSNGCSLVEEGNDKGLVEY
jgi:hypothetical protein